jgi:hypothetical protein
MIRNGAWGTSPDMLSFPYSCSGLSGSWQLGGHKGKIPFAMPKERSWGGNGLSADPGVLLMTLFSGCPLYYSLDHHPTTNLDHGHFCGSLLSLGGFYFQSCSLRYCICISGSTGRNDWIGGTAEMFKETHPSRVSWTPCLGQLISVGVRDPTGKFYSILNHWGKWSPDVSKGKYVHLKTCQTRIGMLCGLHWSNW